MEGLGDPAAAALSINYQYQTNDVNSVFYLNVAQIENTDCRKMNIPTGGEKSEQG